MWVGTREFVGMSTRVNDHRKHQRCGCKLARGNAPGQAKRRLEPQRGGVRVLRAQFGYLAALRLSGAGGPSQGRCPWLNYLRTFGATLDEERECSEQRRAFFAVFLCVFATLREHPTRDPRITVHAKTLSRKEDHSKIANQRRCLCKNLMILYPSRYTHGFSPSV
jgi:hypothetical protein